MLHLLLSYTPIPPRELIPPSLQWRQHVELIPKRWPFRPTEPRQTSQLHRPADVALCQLPFADASTSSGKTITVWNWDFGDSTTYNGKTPPSHLYSSPGTYTVKLTVTTTCGTNTKTKSNYITVYGPPTADFTATTTIGCTTADCWPLLIPLTETARR